ncbi:MAG: hypothetical protein ACKV2T_21215 [Kofleriaceae bacterium]
MNPSRALLVAVAVTTASPAAAQNTAEADKLFDKGKQLMAENKLAEACTAFEESQRLAPATTTELNLANCREKNEQLATAHEQFMRVANSLEGKPESKKLREVALQRAAQLQPRLSTLTLVVPSASQVGNLQLQLDARSIAPSQWNQPIALDGGMYKLIARAEDRVEWTTTIALSPSGDTKTIEVPTLAEAKGPETVARKPDAAAGGSLKLPILFGVAAIGLGGAALGLELWGRSIYQESKDELFDRERQLDLLDSANTRHISAQVAGIAALGCATAAVVFYVTREKRTESSVVIAPVTSPTSVGLAAFAHW